MADRALSADATAEAAGGGSLLAGHRGVLGVTVLATFLTYLDITIVNVAFPDIAASFPRSTLDGLSWVLNGYTICFSALLIPLAQAADLLGRKRIMLAGVVLFTLASAAASAAPSVGALVAARVVQGIGAAIIVPTGLALLLEEFPAGERGTIVGLWGAAAAIASAIGPSLGGLLVDASSWRVIFLVNVPVGVFAVVAARRVLRPDQPASPGRPFPDVVGGVLVAGGSALVTLALVRAERWGWGDVRVALCVVAGAACVAAAVLRSRGKPAAIFELALFRVRSFAVGNVAALVFSLGFYAMLLSSVLFLVAHWDYSVLSAGLAITPGPLIAVVAAPIGGRITDAGRPGAAVAAGGLFFAAGMLWFAFVPGSEPDFLADWLPGMLAVGVGVGLAFPSATAAAAESLPPARYAAGLGVNGMFRQFGAVLGVAVLVAILSATEGRPDLGRFEAGFLLSAGAGLVTAALGLMLPQRRSKPMRSSVA